LVSSLSRTGVSRVRKAFWVAVVASIVPGVFAQDKQDKPGKPDTPAPSPSPDAKPAPAPEKKPEPEKTDKKPEDPKAIPGDLARIFARFDKHPEPARALECAYARALYYHLARDIERVLECFHRDFAHHKPNGEVVNVTRVELRELLKSGYDATPPTKLTLEELIDFSRIRVYTKAQARESKDEGWHKEPSEISTVMADEDQLVIAPLRPAGQGEKTTAFEADLFYVFRREGSDWKIVLGE
jgi:hypothetical protein